MDRYCWRLAFALIAVCAVARSPASEGDDAVQRGLAALAEGKFAEAEKILLPVAARHPDTGAVLQALGQVMEKQGRLDEAWGYYQAAAHAKGGEARLPSDIKARLRQAEVFAAGLEKVREAVVRDLLPLTRDAKRQPEQALPLLGLICRLAPERRHLEAYWEALTQSQKPPEPQLPGYRCLFNQFDFTNWEVLTGSWIVSKQTMIADWGRIRYPERLPSYIFRMSYRCKIERGQEESVPSLWIHKDPSPDHFAGVEIILYGRRAGSVRWLLPDPKYGEAVENGEQPCRLLKDSPYKPDDWNEIEVNVKLQAVAVKLNGKTVFESLKGAFIEGWRGEEKKNFPGCIEINAPTRLEIKTVFLRKISSS